MMMTACDLGAVTKPWDISRKVRSGTATQVRRRDSFTRSSFLLELQVAELVTSEFFEQGDRERSELKLTPSVSGPPPSLPRSLPPSSSASPRARDASVGFLFSSHAPQADNVRPALAAPRD